MKRISIIGFGRFGKTLLKLMKNDFLIVLYDIDNKVFKNLHKPKNVKVTDKLEEVFESEIIIYAIPISLFEGTIAEHKSYFTAKHLVMDVLSVKIHPKKVFQKYLSGAHTQVLLTHPMFGPDSSKSGFKDLVIVLDKFKSSYNNYNYWRSFFKKKGLKVVTMSADKHDKLAARSQGVAHFIGRALQMINYQNTEIDTASAKMLENVMELTTADKYQLFQDLQKYNPYTRIVRKSLISAMRDIENRL